MTNPEEFPTSTEAAVLPAPIEKSAYENMVEKAQAEIEARRDRIGAKFGEVATRLVASMNNPEASALDKAGAIGASVAGFTGAGVKTLMGEVAPLAGLTRTIGGEKAGDIYSAGTDAFSDTFVDKVAIENDDGTYGFDALGVAKVANMKGLAKTGVEGVANGLDAAMAKSAEHADQELEDDPNSKVAKATKAAYGVYENPLMHGVKKMATKAAVNRLVK